MTSNEPLDMFDTDVAQVRALIPDIEKVPNPNRPTSKGEYLFGDSHLEALLALNGGNVRLAAADACEALGTSEGLIAKVITSQDVKTDGAKLMGQFLQRARLLRQQASDEALEDGEAFGFFFVPYEPTRGRWPG